MTALLSPGLVVKPGNSLTDTGQHQHYRGFYQNKIGTLKGGSREKTPLHFMKSIQKPVPVVGRFNDNTFHISLEWF